MSIKWLDERAGLEFVGLAWLSIASLFWLAFHGPAWLPALIILIFIGINIWAGRNPYRRTPFDFVLVLFLLMAMVGVWAAYNRETAIDKFWMLLLAITVYYAIAGQPRKHTALLIGLMSVCGVLISLHFLLFYDWRTLPVDFRTITRLGLSWMEVRPALQGQSLSPNITAGILAGFFPFTLALGASIWQRRSTIVGSWVLLMIALSFASLQALAIFMTSSRGAWFALALSLGLWLILAMGDKFKVQLSRPWKLTFIFVGIAFVIFASSVIVFRISDPARVLDLAPGLPTGESRQGIDRFTLRLIRDFPFTGGGLGAFPGLFSRYMLVIPNLFFEYSHNLYLDVAIEQGLPGLFAFLVILGGSGFLLLRTPVDEDANPGLYLLRLAALASLVVLVIHGLIDDAYYGERGTPFVWIVAGLAVFTHPNVRTMAGLIPSRLDGEHRTLGHRRWMWFAWISIALAIVVSGVVTWRQLAAGWLANLGAVRMARVQLSDFPNNQWSGKDTGESLESPRGFLETAISFDPANQTALYRLGLIAMQNQDFQTAIKYLEAAYRQDVGHRGVKKNLGYVYAWGGQYERAQILLARIPEARREMQFYSLWWAAHNRPDLAQDAQEMVRRLANVNSNRPVALSSRLVIP